MKCALCQEREADKKNTHYLTDGIIRSCLNYDGGNVRESGLYFDVSSSTTFTETNFQRATSQSAIEKDLGRQPNENEIERAKKIPFSVDFVFCDTCEDIFTGIENSFLDKHLAQFRNGTGLKDVTAISYDCPSIRLFFLLQIWRTGVCVPKFKISANVMEKLRCLIQKPDDTAIKAFPLCVTYLTTTADPNDPTATNENAYTSNMVGHSADNKNAVIFMNDFVVQFYEDVNNISFDTLYGINNPKDFQKFLNYEEKEFIIKVLSDKQRRDVYTKMHDERAQKVLNAHYQTFAEIWEKLCKKPPTEELAQKYVSELVNWDALPQGERLSKNRVKEFTANFIKTHCLKKE